MSYSLIDIPKENYLRVITDSTPLYIPMGALSAADATTLIVGLVVSAFSGTSATITMEESYDGGSTYTAVPSFTADTINGTGVFKVKVDAGNGPLSPVVRIKVTAAAATTLYFSRVFRTFVQSNVMVPRDVTVSSAAATEATQIQVLGQLTMIEGNTDGIEGQLTTVVGYIDGIETLVTSTNSKLDTLNSKDFATEATLAKLKKWPYATYAKIVPTSDVNNEYYTYKTSGDVTVGTITKAIATGIITYSPDKVV